jgi:hypothetical protein
MSFVIFTKEGGRHVLRRYEPIQTHRCTGTNVVLSYLHISDRIKRIIHTEEGNGGGIVLYIYIYTVCKPVMTNWMLEDTLQTERWMQGNI